jgi:two-component system C4-dicarboxylate transport sensor histidine kinase DctB
MVELAAHLPVIPRFFGEMSVERLHELQRFAEVGRASASLIHDISSPLTAAILHLEQEEHSGLSSIKHARRSIRVLERYLEAARQQLRQEDRVTSFRVKHEIDQVKRIMQPLACRQHVKLRFDLRSDCKLIGDPVKFQQIVSNLITNAMEAYRDPAALPVKPLVRVLVAADQQWLAIRIQDWGEGIEAKQLPLIFEPFYTTKPSSAASGSGIGLSTVKRYVEDDFVGRISVASSPNSGTEFSVKLRLPA